MDLIVPFLCTMGQLQVEEELERFGLSRHLEVPSDEELARHGCNCEHLFDQSNCLRECARMTGRKNEEGVVRGGENVVYCRSKGNDRFVGGHGGMIWWGSFWRGTGPRPLQKALDERDRYSRKYSRAKL